MDFKEQVKILKNSNQVHGNWYKTTYPDVAKVGMDPVLHYLKYGVIMGRNPQRWFNTQFYLETYPDVAESGMNPLLHYVLYGAAKGYKKKPEDPAKEAKREVNLIRGKLHSLGFTEQPLLELRELVENSEIPAGRALAARELALWCMREKTDAGYQQALEWIGKARQDAADQEHEFLCRLNTIELLCHYHLGSELDGRAVYEYAENRQEIDADTRLAWVNYQESPEARCQIVNQVLAQYDIPSVTLLHDTSLPIYDRLTSAVALPKVTADQGPKVTVLVAAYNAANMIPTTLRSLQEQTWQNLEILILDDCSTDNTCEVVEAYAAQDSRIRLIRMEKNGGAYVARNRGLDEACGEYVTIHDADDWSHPKKIELQARYLQENADAMGCTSQQARAYSDLSFLRWTGGGHYIITNTSSFMFKKAPMREKLGYWDTVRFSADNELIRRMKRIFGEASVKHMVTGPLSFQRDSNSSIVADEALGINGFLFGVRKEYLDSQAYFHANAETLRYESGSQRPYAAPRIMHPDRDKAGKPRHYQIILASDFRMHGGSVQSCIEDIKAAKKFGIKIAIVEMYRYDLGKTSRKHMLDEVRKEIDGENVDVLTFGEEATCDLLLLRYPPILQHKQRYVPKIHANNIKVIVNQPPMSDYTASGVIRYDIGRCAENIRHYFGKDAEWHPIGPLVRDALTEHHADELRHIHLAEQDWYNIIDLSGWDRGYYRRPPMQKLRIGRHSRDNFVKWPATKEDMLAAYPEADDIEIHVLGGVKTPAEIIGYVPDNWVVHEFDALHPKDFLANIDVFVYFSHPDWVESFGRTIIEAMAVGVPVILPEVYRPLFKEAAIYATPATAIPEARRLFNDTNYYNKQVEKAKQFAENNFGYKMHLDRLSYYFT